MVGVTEEELCCTTLPEVYVVVFSTQILLGCQPSKRFIGLAVSYRMAWSCRQRSGRGMALSSGHTSGNFAPRGSVALVPVTQRRRTHGGPGGPGDSEDTLENTWARSYQDLHTEWLTHEMPVSARKRAKGGEFKERLKMRKEDDRSHLVNLFLTARASSIEFAPAFGAPACGVGQSILQWWAPWFKDCLEGAEKFTCA